MGHSENVQKWETCIMQIMLLSHNGFSGIHVDWTSIETISPRIVTAAVVYSYSFDCWVRINRVERETWTSRSDRASCSIVGRIGVWAAARREWIERRTVIMAVDESIIRSIHRVSVSIVWPTGVPARILFYSSSSGGSCFFSQLTQASSFPRRGGWSSGRSVSRISAFRHGSTSRVWQTTHTSTGSRVSTWKCVELAIGSIVMTRRRRWSQDTRSIVSSRVALILIEVTIRRIIMVGMWVNGTHRCTWPLSICSEKREKDRCVSCCEPLCREDDRASEKRNKWKMRKERKW